MGVVSRLGREIASRLFSAEEPKFTLQGEWVWDAQRSRLRSLGAGMAYTSTCARVGIVEKAGGQHKWPPILSSIDKWLFSGRGLYLQIPYNWLVVSRKSPFLDVTSPNEPFEGGRSLIAPAPGVGDALTKTSNQLSLLPHYLEAPGPGKVDARSIRGRYCYRVPA